MSRDHLSRGTATCESPITSTDTSVPEFIARWAASSSAERANYTMFLTELCNMLDVPDPQPTRGDDHDNAYVFGHADPMDDGEGKPPHRVARCGHEAVAGVTIQGDDLRAVRLIGDQIGS